MSRALTRRRAGAGLALLVAVAVVLVLVLGNNSPSAGSTNNAAFDSAGTTAVQRRDLVQTDTESGTLSFANPQTVYNNLSGTITWLPQVGQLIKPGQTLYRVDDVPVMLMNGSTPAYRDLSAADTPGQDILELNRNLVALGFNPDGIVIDDTWQAATTDGVDVLQAYLGQTETGDLSLGQVVFLPGPQLVSSLDETLGADPGGASSAASLSSVAPAAPTTFVSLQTGTTSTPTTTSPGPTSGPGPAGGPPQRRHRPGHHKAGKVTSLRALIALLKAEIAELKAQRSSGPSGGKSGSSGGHSGSSSGHSGSSGGHSGSSGGHSGSSSSGSGSGSPSSGGGGGTGGGTAVLEMTSTELMATVDLDPSKQSEARVGDRVTVEMPAGNTVGGRITAVSSVAQSSSGSSGSGSGGGGGSSPGGGGSGSGSSSAIPVTIALNRRPRAKGLDQAAVSVNFEQAEAKNVLSVPVTALLALPGGHYAIQQAASPRKLVPVTTGLFAAGYVQISGSGVHEGLQVTNSEG